MNDLLHTDAARALLAAGLLPWIIVLLLAQSGAIVVLAFKARQWKTAYRAALEANIERVLAALRAEWQP